MNDLQADHSLDARGRRCSMLSMMVAEKMAGVSPGDVLEVVTDDPGAPQEMPTWCKRTGNELLQLSEDGDEYIIVMRKGES